MAGLTIDETLLQSVIRGTIEGLSMTGIEPDPVGASKFLSATREISVIVSLYGKRNGSMTLNLSRQTALFLASKLLGEDQAELTEDTFDGISELGNIIAGRYKDLLLGTDFEITGISLPALIMGANYDLYHARGITTASVEFEIREIPMVHMRDKFFTSSVSLMRR